MAEKEDRNYEKIVVDTCVLAGTIMIESGSEVSRVNDTMLRIAKNAGLKDPQIYVTVTGIIMSGTADSGAQVGSVDKRSFDLEKVTEVNELSREFAAKKIDINTFYDSLVHIDDLVSMFPEWLQILGAGIVGATLVVVFRNDIHDFWITLAIAALGWIIYYLMGKYIQVKFLSEFLAAVGVAFAATFAVILGLGINSDDIIVGGMMPLVPGIPLTNAIRDMLSGNLVSGIARGVEALLSACALGFGVALVIRFF